MSIVWGIVRVFEEIGALTYGRRNVLPLLAAAAIPIAPFLFVVWLALG